MQTNSKTSYTETREHRPVFPGIVADAKRLGVSRMHLWAVLSGRRKSPNLIARYKELKGHLSTNDQPGVSNVK